MAYVDYDETNGYYVVRTATGYAKSWHRSYSAAVIARNLLNNNGE